MEQLIELLQQIQDLAGSAIDALKGAAEEAGPKEGGPPKGDGPPEGGPPKGDGPPPEGGRGGPPPGEEQRR